MAASPKQVDYINKLLTMKTVPATLRAHAEDVLAKADTVAWRVVSDLIENLKYCPWVPREGQVAVPVLAAGTYAHGDVILRVQISRTSGKPYAKVWTGSGWEYDSQAYRAHAAHAVVIPLEQALAIGVATGHCVCCARDLTDPLSVEAGIGPVCVKDYGTTRADIIAARKRQLASVAA